MLAEFIEKETYTFNRSRAHLHARLDWMEQQLAEYAQRENAKQGYIDKQKELIKMIDAYDNAVMDLLNVIGTAKTVLGGCYGCSASSLRDENRLLKKYITVLGHDPSVVYFLKDSDFM